MYSCSMEFKHFSNFKMKACFWVCFKQFYHSYNHGCFVDDLEIILKDENKKTNIVQYYAHVKIAVSVRKVKL